MSLQSGWWRVGVLTLHRPVNYGSYWQARCLLEALAAKGHHAELIDHDGPAERVKEHRLSLQPTLPIPIEPEDRPRYAAKIRAFAHPLCALPKSPTTTLDSLTDFPPYDAVIVGSDEVWNLRHPVYGGRPPFFGVGLPTRRAIAYAPSFGNYSCWEGIGEPWTDHLRAFHALSVRDENSWWMLKHALGIELPLVLDPCLLSPSMPEGKPDARLELPYALVYGHNFTFGFARKARAWADARGVKLLSVGYRNEWAHETWIEADPIQFAHAAANAGAVLTNFFHGCVFALANHKPFATEITDYRAIKVRGLMEAVDGEAHLLREGGDLARVLACPPAPAIAARIAALRDDSHAYLDRALA